MKQDQADQAANPRAARQRRFWLFRSGEWSPRASRQACTCSKVAQRYRVNANLLFTWRCQKGSSNAAGGAEPLKLLPVTVADAGTATAAAATQSKVGRMEIVLNSGERIIVGADADASSLARVVKALSRR